MKTCSKCGITGEDNLFASKSKLCKPCFNNKKREKYAQNEELREKIKANQRAKNLINKEKKENLVEGAATKHCNGCDQDKDLTLFRIDRAKCNDCEKKDGCDYRQSEVGKGNATAWVEQNSEQMAKLQAEWYQKNKTRINKKICGTIPYRFYF